jgi:hypothetical protein
VGPFIEIEGVSFKVEDAREFAKRLLPKGIVNFMPLVSKAYGPKQELAFRIELCIRDEGAWEVPVYRDDVKVTLATLEAWVQDRDAPDAARTLYRAMRALQIADDQ